MKTVDEIMEQAQVFASTWSLVGGMFDGGDLLNIANDAKAELRVMVEAALNEQAAHVAELEKDRDYCEKHWHEALATHENIAALKSRIAELERQLLEARMDALPAMREYARKNPKHQFSTDGTEQDPNGAHAWLERNDKPNTTNDRAGTGPVHELERQLSDEIAVIQRLLDLARQVDHALDDSEEEVCDGVRSHNITGQDFDDVLEALDALEDLPDDRPGMTLGPAGKAEWALRRLLPITGDDE